MKGFKTFWLLRNNYGMKHAKQFPTKALREIGKGDGKGGKGGKGGKVGHLPHYYVFEPLI